MDQAQKLRDLASWYREFAERAGNPAIWDSRLRTAEDLEREAGNLEVGASDCWRGRFNQDACRPVRAAPATASN